MLYHVVPSQWNFIVYVVEAKAPKVTDVVNVPEELRILVPRDNIVTDAVELCPLVMTMTLPVLVETVGSIIVVFVAPVDTIRV